MFRKEYQPKVEIHLPANKELATAIDYQLKQGTLSNQGRQLIINATLAKRQRYREQRREAEKERWKLVKYQWKNGQAPDIDDMLLGERSYTRTTGGVTVGYDYSLTPYNPERITVNQRTETVQEQDTGLGIIGMIFSMIWRMILWPIWHYLIEFPMLWIVHQISLHLGFLVIPGTSRTLRIIASKWVLLPLFVASLLGYLRWDLFFAVLLFIPTTFFRFSFIPYALLVGGFAFAFMDEVGWYGWLFLGVMSLLAWQIRREKRSMTTSQPDIVTAQVNSEIDRMMAYYRRQKR